MRQPAVGLVGRAFIDGKSHELSAAADQRTCFVIPFGRIGSDERAAALLQAVVNQPDGIAERIGIGTAVAAAEKRHLFTAQILRLQLIQKAVPVVLQFACAPRRRTQHEQVVFLHFAGRRIGHIVYIGVRDAQLFGNIRSHGLGRAHRTAEKDTSHNFVVFGLRQRNSIPTGSPIPDFRGFGAAG